MGAGVLIRVQGQLPAIARAVGTPVYVYYASVIRARYADLTAAMAGIPHRIHYSVKANGNLAVLGVLRELGAGADVVSGGEVERVLRAGFDVADVIFSGVGKTADELRRALRAGVGQINVESFDEMRLVGELAYELGVRARVGIRVNPDVTVETHPYTQTGSKDMKFGAPADEAVPMARWAAKHPALRLVSLGMHIGSQIADAKHYREGGARLVKLVRRVREAGVSSLENVDAGGGLGIRYTVERPLDLAAYAGAIRPLTEATGLPVVIEPGRFLVGPAGVLLTRCLYRKRAGGKTFVIVDAGMSDLLRPSLYGAAHPVEVLGGGDDPAPAGDDRADVVGPICESGDFLALGRSLEGVVRGTLLAIGVAGAYGFVMSSNYNSRPRVAEVLCDGGRWAVVREREHVDDLMRGEHTLADVAAAWRSDGGEKA